MSRRSGFQLRAVIFSFLFVFGFDCCCNGQDRPVGTGLRDVLRAIRDDLFRSGYLRTQLGMTESQIREINSLVDAERERTLQYSFAYSQNDRNFYKLKTITREQHELKKQELSDSMSRQPSELLDSLNKKLKSSFKNAMN